ncbi:SMC-Scp complex subunit ScpB [Rhizobium sp. LjRoot254]|uniref:SMC-Scp complex subunit ScpB n=1 Tax=Rhizobium sp. LjRoot254 TaxID=3342297 RepID=UPI003ECC756B
MTEPDPDNDNNSGPVLAELLASDAARTVEALIFASAGPVSTNYLIERLPQGTDIDAILRALRTLYVARGVNLVSIDGHWAFRTATDLSFALRRDEHEVKKLSRAALEVLAIIAYHQPVTRAEIEDIRGVQTSKGTLDVLLEAGWVKFRGRRRTPGRPVTFGTTRDFLDHFGLEEIRDLPGVDELKAAGMLSGRIPANLSMPVPRDEEFDADEDPITQLDLEELGLLTPGGKEEE